MQRERHTHTQNFLSKIPQSLRRETKFVVTQDTNHSERKREFVTKQNTNRKLRERHTTNFPSKILTIYREGDTQTQLRK